MTVPDEGMASRAATIIARWGQPSYLLRGTVARPCIAAIVNHTPRARGLALESAEEFYIAAPLATEPDFEQDKLIFVGRLYQFPEEIKGPRPAGIVIFYDANAIYEASYDFSSELEAGHISLEDA